MQTIHNDDSLGLAIRNLERQQQADWQDLTHHFHETVHELNPKTIIREKIEDLTGGSTAKGKLLQYGVGLLGGFVAKRAIVGKPKNFFTRFLGTAIQSAVSGFIVKQPIVPKNHE